MFIMSIPAKRIKSMKKKKFVNINKILLVIQCFTGGIRKYIGSMKKVVLGVCFILTSYFALCLQIPAILNEDRRRREYRKRGGGILK